MADKIELPHSIITRLVKDGAQESLQSLQKTETGVIITKDAKQAYSQIAGLFVLYIASTASDISKEHKRSKITAEDVFKALNELGFENYEEQLREFLKNYNVDKEDQPKKVVVQKRAAPDVQNAADEDHSMDEEDDQVQSKRTKLNE